jgi:uncharacterized repeat protein (TIGR03803 family)
MSSKWSMALAFAMVLVSAFILPQAARAQTFTTVYSFSGNIFGATPDAVPVQGTDGDYYGTTYQGGPDGDGCGFAGCGLVYKITSGGKYTELYSFCTQPELESYNCPHGSFPEAGLVQGADGNFYGTTHSGGRSVCGVGSSYQCGTIFKITPGGELDTLYSFCQQPNCADGTYPTGGLATEYSFCSQTYCEDGGQPAAGLYQATNGHIYGTTTLFGAYAPGTLFSLSGGALSRLFVETQTTLGSGGAEVNILGNKLTGTTEVTFNGTAATFEVVSETEITTTVPSGATTGVVAVTTPKGVLKTHTVSTVR